MEAKTTGCDSKKPIFRDLDASDNLEDLETSEVESLCMNCHENGVTRLLLTKIPLFREIILMSFSCPHCHYSDSEIQPGGAIQDQGVKYTVHVANKEHLNRLVVKADSAIVKIPHLEFEVPPNTQKGKVSTIESVIRLAVEDLEKEQPVRKVVQPDVAEKLEGFIEKLKKCLDVMTPFIFELDDVTGNSFVENKLAPSPDPNLTIVKYNRSEQQDRQLGLLEDTEAADDEEAQTDDTPSTDEVITFQTNCSQCHSPTETRMKVTDIPHFKQVIIMATSCDYCGFKTNEVKSGAGVSPHGVKITLHITDITDLSRDILKAETSSLSIPELELDLQAGTLGGQFTTVEGILTQVRDQLKGSNPFIGGDSETGSKLKCFLKQLEEVIAGSRLDIHLILDDPAGNSYVQNTYAPDVDPELTVEHYERTFAQNDLLGLNDMKTEEYVDT